MTLNVSAEAPSNVDGRPRVPSPAVRLLIAAGTSFYGDWLTTVALVVLLFRLTRSPIGPALYIVARVAPRVIGPLPGGLLADRYGPARVAASCAVLQAVTTASIVVFAEARMTWAIYAAVVAAQLIGSAAQPCYGALVPRVTTADRLGRVQGAYSAIQSSSILVAPAIGALVLPFAAPEILISFDAASFVIAAALLITLFGVERNGGAPIATERGIKVGLRYVLRDPTMRFFAAASLANPAAVTALQAVLVVAAAQHFGHDTAVGWLYAAVGAGGIAGTLPLIRRTPARVGLAWIIGPSALELLPLALFVFVLILPVAMLLLFLSSLGATLYQTRGMVGLQQRVPLDALGRAGSVITLALSTGMVIGAVAATVLVSVFGWESTVLIVCSCSAAFLFAAAVSEGGRQTA
jgi:predicted MFS family arabinose efflux permease